MATAKKNVTAKTVREWFAALPESQREGITAPGSRGRLHPTLTEAYNGDKANRKAGRVYTEKVAEGRTVTVKVKAKDKAGRNISKTVTLKTAEARALLGHPKGQMGRFKTADLVAALETQNA